jgi:ribosomal-protein-alanine N-acetyltransferase
MNIKNLMLNISFDPFPVLTTERLVLRRLTEADAESVFQLRRDENLMKYVARPLAKSIEDAIALIHKVENGIKNNESINWGITLKGHDKVIGVAGIVRTTPEHHRGEIGYLLASEHQRKGFTAEAIKEILFYGFEKLGLHLIEAITDPRNTASISVLKKLGFSMDGHFRENTLYEGQFLDSMHFSLLSKDFKR